MVTLCIWGTRESNGNVAFTVSLLRSRSYNPRSRTASPAPCFCNRQQLREVPREESPPRCSAILLLSLPQLHNNRGVKVIPKSHKGFQHFLQARKTAQCSNLPKYASQTTATSISSPSFEPGLHSLGNALLTQILNPEP